MSFDMERAVERAISRLRGIAQARGADGDTWIANALYEIAESLGQPLEAARSAQKREEERQAARLWKQ